MGLVQRNIEAAGIPTVSITMVPELTRRVRPPRALQVPFPLGHPFGYPGQAFLQRRVLSLMLEGAAEIAAPGTVAPVPGTVLSEVLPPLTMK